MSPPAQLHLLTSSGEIISPTHSPLNPWAFSPCSAHSQSVVCDEQSFVFEGKNSQTDSLSARRAPGPMALELVGNSKRAAQIAVS